MSQTSSRRIMRFSSGRSRCARAVAVGLERGVERRVDRRGDAALAAIRATAPESHGASSRLPATRSFSIDERISAGSAVGEAHLLRDEVVGERDAARARHASTPRASPPRTCARRSGSPRTTPIGCRATLVSPDIAARNTNFSHSARRMSATSSASMPAPSHAARNASAAGCCAGSTGAEAQARHRAGVRDDARLARSSPRCTRRRPSRCSAPTHRADALDALDAVLERDDDTAAREQRPHRCRPRSRCPRA